MNNLSKENFFNERQRLYPKAMKLFCDYIDEYKKLVDWRSLFTTHDCDCPCDYTDFDISPKFHDVPFELQVGVIMAFVEGLTPESHNQYGAAYLLQDGFNVAGIKLNLTRIFARIENNLLL